MAEPEAVLRRKVAPQAEPPVTTEHDQPAEVLSGAAAAEVQRLRRGYLTLEQRLLRLRQRARRGAWTATWLSAICSSLMLGLIGGIGTAALYAWLRFGAQAAPHLASMPSPLQAVLTTELLIIPPLLVFAFVRMLVQLFTAHKLFAFYYRDSLSRLDGQSEALCYADEDYRQLLEEARQQNIGSMAFFQPKERQRTLERQLEYSACFGLPLRCVAQLKPLRGRLEYVWGQALYRFQGIFQLPLWAWLTMLLVGLGLPVAFGLTVAQLISSPQSHTTPGMPSWFFALSMLMPISTMLFVLPLGVGLQYSPRYIISRARLVALLDFLLERPQVDPATLPKPPEPKGWWARQFTPWKCRDKAPK